MATNKANSKDTSKDKGTDDEGKATTGELVVLAVIVGGLVILTGIYLNQIIQSRGLLAPADPIVSDDAGTFDEFDGE